jgi:outer membrane protein TolC
VACVVQNGVKVKRLLALGAVFCCFHTAVAADLIAVYQRALQNDPQLREAEANRLAALESKPQALSALLPQLNGSALASKEKDTGPSNQVESVNLPGQPTQFESFPFDGRSITHTASTAST